MLTNYGFLLSTLSMALTLITVSNASHHGFSDISDSPDTLFNTVIKFKLDRTELSGPGLRKFAVRPYAIHEEGELGQGEQEQILPLQQALQEQQHNEPVVAVPLTDIPKHYGYTAVFTIGTYDGSQVSSSSIPPHSSASRFPFIAKRPDYLFNLLVDTGSDLVVVTSASCADPECIQVPHRYDSSLSRTATLAKNMLTGGHRWVQQYGDGTIANGTLFQDTLGFVSPVNADKPGAQASITASLTTATTLQIKNQPILVVDQPGLGLTKSYGHGVDGIIGLNLRSPVISSTVIQNLQKIEATASAAKAAKEAVAATTPLSSLLSSSARPVLHHTPAFSTDSKAGMGIMSLWLSKSLEPGQGGELLLNAVDKSRFREPIRWSARGPSPYDWSIMMDKGILLFLDQESPATSTTTVGLLKPKTATDFRDKTAPTATATVTAQVLVPGTEYTYAVLDSGSDGIYLAKSTYHAFFQHVPGARQLKSGYWRVPCEGTTELAFGIEGMLYKVPYQDWVKKPNETVSSASAALTQAELGPGMCQSRVFGSSPGPTLLGTVFLRAVYTVFDFSRPGHERMGFAALA